MMDGSLELGVIALRQVLFPGMKLVIHLTEERDRLLVKRCWERDEPFGVLFCDASGLSAIGTVARVLHVEQTAISRQTGQFSRVTILGLARFQIGVQQIARACERQPVQILADGDCADEGCRHAAAQAAAAFLEYLAALLTLANRRTSEIKLPTDSLSLSYAIAASLQIAEDERQGLLMTGGIEERLREELRILERERRLLGRTIVREATGGSTMSRLSPN